MRAVLAVLCLVYAPLWAGLAFTDAPTAARVAFGGWAVACAVLAWHVAPARRTVPVAPGELKNEIPRTSFGEYVKGAFVFAASAGLFFWLAEGVFD